MRLHRTWPRRVTAAVTGAVALTLAGGIAYGAWSALGAGSTKATAGSTAPLGVTAVVGAQLSPGSSTSLTVTVSNPNPAPVTVTSLTRSAVSASPGCTTSGVTVTLPGTVSIVVPAGGSTQTPFPNAVAMSTASSSDCQGATFSVDLTAAGVTP